MVIDSSPGQLAAMSSIKKRICSIAATTVSGRAGASVGGVAGVSGRESADVPGVDVSGAAGGGGEAGGEPGEVWAVAGAVVWASGCADAKRGITHT